MPLQQQWEQDKSFNTFWHEEGQMKGNFFYSWGVKLWVEDEEEVISSPAMFYCTLAKENEAKDQRNNKTRHEKVSN